MTFEYTLTAPIQQWKQEIEESCEGYGFMPWYVSKNHDPVPVQDYLEAIQKLSEVSQAVTATHTRSRSIVGMYPVWCYSIDDSWVTYFEIRYPWLLDSMEKIYPNIDSKTQRKKIKQ